MEINLNNKWVFITIIVLAGLIAGGILLYSERHVGETAAKLKQADAQLKLNQKVKKAYDKIDKQIPASGDDDAAIEFLRHASSGK